MRQKDGCQPSVPVYMCVLANVYEKCSNNYSLSSHLLVVIVVVVLLLLYDVIFFCACLAELKPVSLCRTPARTFFCLLPACLSDSEGTFQASWDLPGTIWLCWRTPNLVAGG